MPRASTHRACATSVSPRTSQPISSLHIAPVRQRLAEVERTDMGWEVYAPGLTAVLRRVHEEYGASNVYVTENGAAYAGIDDAPRVRYLESHVAAAADALDAGVPLAGYFVWSLLDNFEWAYGFSKRFGLVHVDYETQRRTVKSSGRWYRDLIATHR